MLCVFWERVAIWRPFLISPFEMILVVKNNSTSVENTVYLTPKEKRGAANVAEYGATIQALGMELTSLIMLISRSISFRLLLPRTVFCSTFIAISLLLGFVGLPTYTFPKAPPPKKW